MDPYRNGLELEEDDKAIFEAMDVNISGDEVEVPNTLSIFSQTQNSKTGKVFGEFLELLQEVEKSCAENINKVLADKLTSAPERVYQILHESGCERDLSYSLQVICNGLLHFQNREHIYGNRLDAFRPFLKILFENCIRTLESIDNWTSTNSDILDKFDEESSDEVIEVLMEIILPISSISSTGIRSASKILVTLLRAANSISISSDVVKRLSSEIVKLINTDKLKIANFLIKLLGSFTKEVFQKNFELGKAIPDMVNLFIQLQRVKDGELPSKNSLLRLLLSARDFVGDICEFEKDYEGDKISFLCSVMGALINFPASTRRNQSCGIIKLVVDSLETNKSTESADILDVIDEQILPKVCQLINSFDEKEFNNLQEVLFTSAINFKKFFVLEFLADIYSFICKISPVSLGREYMICFCKNSMPLHMKVFILPAIARSVDPKMCNIQTNSGFICKFELINNKCRTKNLEKEDCLFIETFWTSIAAGELKPREWETILAIFLRMRYTAKKMDNKLTAQVLGTLLKLLNKCMYSQLAAVTALQILQYVERKSDEIVFKILRLYVKGDSDDYILSLLKYFLERGDVVLKLEDYEKNSIVDLIISIEESIDKISSMGNVNAEEKEKIKSIICSLQKFL